MKANLPQTEPAFIDQWEKEHLYEKLQDHRRGVAPFILHDGPPYANGDIHMGHALNKTLKDFIVRYRSLRGSAAPFVPGWDCHGLPIEYALMKELKVTKHQVDIVDFRRQARAYALKYVDLQRKQFQRLGCWGDWEHPYLTLEPGYVGAALRALAKLTRQGFVTRARKPVNWCWSCETALAEAEVEYETHTSPSIYVKFELTDESAKHFGDLRHLAGIDSQGQSPKVYLIIWTTTPWTLMGNVAVTVRPEFEYALWQGTSTSPDIWITLADLPASARKDLNITERTHRAPKTFRGRELEGLSYDHPFGIRQGKVVLADYVSSEDGTGLVHTAPDFGAEDFLTGRRCKLEQLPELVDSKGQFVGLPKEVERFNGRRAQEADSGIIGLLQEKAVLAVSPKDIRHSYPHCWRCHEPIIFRATDQWFLKVEHEGLREKLLSVIDQVRWIPPEGRERMLGMIKTRPDWCLSRQRLWGIPIPALLCKACGEGTLDPGVVEAFAAVAEKDPEGSDRWFTEPVSRWLPPNFSCRCGQKQFDRGTDILDVWFDSGVSHEGVLAIRQGLAKPADLYLEGSDQHRGWFQVSLITSTALYGKAPYKAVLTHGFVVDGEGRKMSKSLGNVIAPQEVISSAGADVLRLWVASSDYREDVRVSSKILSHVADTYRKIRNTLRFCLANLTDFDPAAAPAHQQLLPMDRWILIQLGRLVEQVTKDYEAYTFHQVVKSIHEFCTVQLSNFYLDVVKDRLYTSHPKDPARLSAQATLFELARTLILLVAPLLPMTAEQVWAVLFPGSQESVHLQDWPDPKRFPSDPALEADWQRLLAMRDDAMKVLEEARQKGLIGDALEAELELATADEKLRKFLTRYQQELAAACIVSCLTVVKENGAATLTMKVAKAPGRKCGRCWMILPSVGSSSQHPDLCHRCQEVLEKIGPI